MLANTPATTSSRVREHKEIPNNSGNIDRQYHHHHHHEHQHLTTHSNKLSHQQQQQLQQHQKQSTKSSRLLSSSISTSVEQPPTLQQQGISSGSICSSTNMNRRNKLSQQHTRFTSYTNVHTISPTTASSVSDVVASNPSAMPPPLPMQDKTDIFHLHYIDQEHSPTSTNINSSVNTTSSCSSSSAIHTQHMESQLQSQSQAQQQHYQMLSKGRHKEDAIDGDKLDYATSSFTNVDDLTNAIRNKVIVEEDEEDILSSDNTYLY